MCGLFAAQQAHSRELTKTRKAEGERFLATLDGGAAQAPEHFTYRPLQDGGFTLYFAEPSFPLPTDFFYLWDRGQQRWVQVEAAELP